MTYFLFNEHCGPQVKRLAEITQQAIIMGISPKLCEKGVGGTYFMYDKSSNIVGVFKPQDQEMGALNNPKGFTPKSASFMDDSDKRGGVSAGESAFREYAAYILDHENFSGVPATDLVVCTHPLFTSPDLDSSQSSSPASSSAPTSNLASVSSFASTTSTASTSPGQLLHPLQARGRQNSQGSFQEYKVHDFDAEDLGSAEIARFPVREVQKICILDIRTFNCDRHGGNILVRRNRLMGRLQRGPARSFRTEDDDDDYDWDCGMQSPVRSPMGRSPDGATMYSPVTRKSSFHRIGDQSRTSTQFLMEFSDDEEEIDRLRDSEEDADEVDSPQTGTLELIPIDHGFCLPHTTDVESDSAYFEWLNWPQSKLPFTEDALSYIDRLNVDNDVNLLKQKLGASLRPECFKVLQVTTLWLKIASRRGFTPNEIGRRMCRRRPDTPSLLHSMCVQAHNEVASQQPTPLVPPMFSLEGPLHDMFLATLTAQMEATPRNL